MYNIYARCNDGVYVDRIITDATIVPDARDHVIGEGTFDECLRATDQYDLYDELGRHNYVWSEESGNIRLLDEDEKPEPQPSEVEVLRQQVELMRKQIEILTGGAE